PSSARSSVLTCSVPLPPRCSSCRPPEPKSTVPLKRPPPATCATSTNGSTLRAPLPSAQSPPDRFPYLFLANRTYNGLYLGICAIGGFFQSRARTHLLVASFHLC